VLDVHDIVSDVQVFQRRQEGSGLAFRGWPMAHPFGKELFFGDDGEPPLSGDEAGREVPLEQVEGRLVFRR
jgi:hypothetical protein